MKDVDFTVGSHRSAVTRPPPVGSNPLQWPPPRPAASGRRPLTPPTHCRMDGGPVATRHRHSGHDFSRAGYNNFRASRRAVDRLAQPRVKLERPRFGAGTVYKRARIVHRGMPVTTSRGRGQGCMQGGVWEGGG